MVDRNRKRRFEYARVSMLIGRVRGEGTARKLVGPRERLASRPIRLRWTSDAGAKKKGAHGEASEQRDWAVAPTGWGAGDSGGDSWAVGRLVMAGWNARGRGVQVRTVDLQAFLLVVALACS